MLIKTQNFDSQLRHDSKLLNISKKPLQNKGSYFTTEMNAPFTDIDYRTIVQFTPALIPLLYTTMKKASTKFRFLFLNAGLLPDYIPPWNIRKGQFNIKEAKSWLQDEDSLSLYDIVAIEKKITDNGIIRWSLEDIRQGFKMIHDIRHDLLVELKQSPKNSVIHLLYQYHDQFVPIDLMLYDPNYFIPLETEGLKSYFTEDWYEIYKTYKRFMQDEGQSFVKKFKDEKRQFDYINSLICSAKTLIRGKRYGSFTELELKRLEQEATNLKDLQAIRSKKAKPLVLNFLNHLKFSNRVEQQYSLLRREDAFISIPTKTLEDSQKSCPFFYYTLEQYDYIKMISNRLLIDYAKLEECFKSISIDFFKIKIVLEDCIGDRSIKENEDGSYRIIDNDGNIIKTGNLEDLQYYLIQ